MHNEAFNDAPEYRKIQQMGVNWSGWGAKHEQNHERHVRLPSTASTLCEEGRTKKNLVFSRTTVGTARAAGSKVALAVLPPLAAAAFATAEFCLHAAAALCGRCKAIHCCATWSFCRGPVSKLFAPGF